MSKAPTDCPIGGSIALYTKGKGGFRGTWIEKPVLFGSVHRLGRNSFRWRLQVRGPEVTGKATTLHQAVTAATAAFTPGMKVRR